MRCLDLEGARNLIPRVLGGLDEPFADASILPTYLLSAFTREQVTVALSGDGGDELFAGYDTFKALGPARWYRRLVPRRLHDGVRRLADLLPISTAQHELRFQAPPRPRRRVLSGVGMESGVDVAAWAARA